MKMLKWCKSFVYTHCPPTGHFMKADLHVTYYHFTTGKTPPQLYSEKYAWWTRWPAVIEDKNPALTLPDSERQIQKLRLEVTKNCLFPSVWQESLNPCIRFCKSKMLFISTSLLKGFIVNDDVDPFNLNEVFHAFVTKCHPLRGIVRLERASVISIIPWLSKQE